MKCGGNVTLSDSEDLPHCLENCRKSCQANGLLDIPVIGITWGRFNEALLDLPPVDIILGSDCFYDSKGISLIFDPDVKDCSISLSLSLSHEKWRQYLYRDHFTHLFFFCFH